MSYDYSAGGWITTRQGHKILLGNPDPDSIDIRDIAYALARFRRWGCHTTVPWTVGQHSVVCCHLSPESFKLEALMHDAAEAYLGDVTKPLKLLIPAYKAMEQRLQNAIADKFKFITPEPPEVKEIDLAVGIAEAELWMVHPDAGYPMKGLTDRRLTDDEKLLMAQPIERDGAVEQTFLSLFHRYER